MGRLPLLPFLALGAIVAGVAACRSDSSLPGDQPLGSFDFQATLLPGTDCGPEDLPDAGGADAGVRFGFSAIITRESATGQAFVTVNGVSRDAGFDGQTVVSVHRAPILFERCRDCSGTQLEETLRLLLLSAPQVVQVGGSCAVALDGGLADGGAPPPQPGVDGGGAVAACGSLAAVLVPGEGCTCTPCTQSYFLESR